MTADDPRDRPDPGDDRSDWEILESRENLDSSTRRALKDLEQIATFNHQLQEDETPRDTTPLEFGTLPGRWGHLMVLERVGAGAQGEVWRAWDPALQRQVALKFLQSAGSAAGGAPSNELVSEARALARVRHPGVVSVFGVAQHDGRTGMWIEWIEGLTLAREIERRGALPAREVAHIGLELCSALEALESAGVVHRDVKPANIVVEAGRRVVLTDFGLGLRPDVDETKGRSSGTPYFMAPELLRGGKPSPRTDLYALGVTLWWALAGRSPFESSTLADLRAEAARGPSTPLRAARPGVPGPLVDVIEWAMRPEELERPRSAVELKERLALVYPGDAADASAPRASWLSRFLTGRGAWWRIAATVLTLAGLFWWAATELRTREEGGAGQWSARQMPTETGNTQDYSLSPDGAKIAYVSDSSSALSVFLIGSNNARAVDRLASGEGTYSNVGWTSDGSKVVATRCDASGEGTMVLVDPITGGRRAIARLGKFGPNEFADMHAALSPDGHFVAVRSDYRPATGLFHTLGVLDVRSGATRTLVRGTNNFVGPPVWNPSGTRVGYLVMDADRSYARLETSDLRGGRSVAMEDSTGFIGPFGSDYRTFLWLSRDRLLYARRRHGYQSDWWALRLDRSGHAVGHAQLVYSTPGALASMPSMSRSGVIAFSAVRMQRRLELIGTDGHPRYPRFQGMELASLESPCWSPDGKSLFVLSHENPERSSIGKVSLSSGAFEEITSAKKQDLPMGLTPDGRELLCLLDSKLVGVPLAGGAPRILAKAFVGSVLYAPRTHDWVVIEHTGASLAVRDFTPGAGIGAVRFRYPAPQLAEGFPPAADLSPDGERIVVITGDSRGYDVLDANTGRLLRETSMPTGANPQSIRWSADTLYATGMDGPAQYWVSRLDPNGRQHLIWSSDDVWAGELAISPNGGTLAFTTLRSIDELWIMHRQ